jgi:FG-GAP-like repeat
LRVGTDLHGFLSDDPIMRDLRINIASLLRVIVLVAVAIAALRESNEMWDSGLFTLTLCALLASILLAVHRSEARRAFWIGFALFGSGYMGLSLIPSIESKLITTKALAYIDSKVPRSGPVGSVHVDLDNDGDVDLYVVNNQQPYVLDLNKGNGTFQAVQQGHTGRSTWIRTVFAAAAGNSANFIRIGHSLLALVMAWLGGKLSRCLYWKN